MNRLAPLVLSIVVSDKSHGRVGFRPRFPEAHTLAWAKAHATSTFVGHVSIVAFHSVKGRSFAERKTTLGASLIPPRRGATLVEVLMALLIMAVGVTSVFTLFPISILKAIKANQVTNAKLYEGAIQDTLLTHSQLWTGAPVWSENTVYGQAGTVATIANRWVTPKPDGRLLPDTNQLFRCVAASPGTSGTRGPAFAINTNWSPTSYAGGYQNAAGAPNSQDGALTWTPYRHSPYRANPLWSAYVVDPLGWHRANLPMVQTQFGNITSGDTTIALAMDRIHCQLGLDAANGIFRLQDSWNQIIETTSVVVSVPGPGLIDIQFPGINPDLILANSLTTNHRLVLNSTVNPPAGSTVTPRAIVIPIVRPNPNPTPYPNNNSSPDTVRVLGTLPTSYTTAGFYPDTASLEVQAPGRYSWLMAVHSGPRGEFNAQCAIVFNRSFETVDEQGYRAEFCVTEDAGDTMWANGRPDTNIAKVRWLYDPDTDPPKIKEGGYIFDASHGYWYKIQKIEVNAERVTAADAPNTTGTYVRTIMTLSDQVQVNSGTVFNDYLVNGTNDCQAVLMPGVVHVFTPETPQ